MAERVPFSEMSDEQLEVLRALPGFEYNTGTPCTCGVSFIRTTKERGFSDSLIFHHRCTECGARFSTWIEG